MRKDYAPPIDQLSPELREQRLRTVIDELRWMRDSLRKENTRLRDRVERQEIKLNAIRKERNSLQERLDHAVRQLSRVA